MSEPRSTRTILSADAKAHFAQVVDDVYSHGTRYIVQRFGAPRAVLISLADFQRLLVAEGNDVRALREAQAEYRPGQERSPEEVAELVGKATGEMPGAG
jgi:prevent-host-death family protein